MEWRSCEARARLLGVRTHLQCSFHHCGGPLKLVKASLGVRKDLESNFHHCAGPVNLGQGSLSTRKEVGSGFHCCRGLAMLVYVSLCGIEYNFHHCGITVKHVHTCLSVRKVCRRHIEMWRVSFDNHNMRRKHRASESPFSLPQSVFQACRGSESPF